MDSIRTSAPAIVADRDRKAEHIALALSERMQVSGSYFDAYSYDHCALPEIALAEVDTSTRFLDRRLDTPLLISCMTGGTDEAARINRNLALAAQSTGVALGVGSQRKALEDASTASSFEVRRYAPDVPILANLGAVQLNYGCGVDECRRVVEMIEADALVFHLNPLQEALQPEGQTDFSALLPKMERVVRDLAVPVIVKEIGCGISGEVGRRLLEIGVRIVDCAGVGGTSWARIEAARARHQAIGELFADWGIPTPQAIRELSAVDGLTVIASGGVRSGVDVAKSISLGAALVGLAQPFLQPATESDEAVANAIRATARELEIVMFCLGVRDLEGLGRQLLRPRSERQTGWEPRGRQE